MPLRYASHRFAHDTTLTIWYQRERQALEDKTKEELSERRRQEISQAQEWTRASALNVVDSDDEKDQRRTKKSSKPRPKPETPQNGSADERETKRRRRGGKLKKNGDTGDEDGAALFSGDEEGENKPAAKKVRFIVNIRQYPRAIADVSFVASTKETRRARR